jgi:hypothetical protein
MILPALLASFDKLQKQLPLPSQTHQQARVIIYELSSSFPSELAGPVNAQHPFRQQSRFHHLCRFISWESEELDERPHALFLTAALNALPTLSVTMLSCWHHSSIEHRVLLMKSVYSLLYCA